MIKFQNEDKTLTVPSGLGNFPSNAGGGDVTRQDVINIVNSAITEYDTEAQVDLEEIRENVSGNTDNIEVISGATENIQSNVNDLSAATVDIQSNVNSANTLASSAYTLASSAYTLADSLTGQTGGPQVVLLNKLSRQERLDLYATINSYYDQETQSFTSAWTEDLYAFYIDLREAQDRQDYQLNDEYEGFFPMQVCRVHPTDYGGGIFFSGAEAGRYGNGILVNIKLIITYDGSFDKGTWWNSPFQAPTECLLGINSGGTLSGDINNFYEAAVNNRYFSVGQTFRPLAIEFRDIEESGETIYQGTVESFYLEHSSIDGNDNSAIFTAKVQWGGRTRVGKWRLYTVNGEIRSETLYWGWLVDGLICVYDDEYYGFTREEKEQWYDRIIEESWNYDNASFGIIRVSNKTSSADTGYDQMSVTYRILRLDSIEAGYNSLHFNGSDVETGGEAENLYSARIARGGGVEYWDTRADFGWLVQKQPSSSGGRYFDLTTAATPVDAYDYNLFYFSAVGLPSTNNNWEYFGPASNGAIRIFDGGDEPVSFANVICSRRLTSSDGYADFEAGARILFEFFDGNDVKRAVCDSIYKGTSTIGEWYVKSLTTVQTV